MGVAAARGVRDSPFGPRLCARVDLTRRALHGRHHGPDHDAPRRAIACRVVRVLLTNDDGIEAAGLQALRRALIRVPEVELAVIAPDGNRSAMARSITTRRPLWVQEVDFEDGTVGYATDGTPVDCVRLAKLGLVEGFQAELVVSGINHGANLGDDITYSGTVAA